MFVPTPSSSYALMKRAGTAVTWSRLGIASVEDEWMSLKDRWKCTDKGKLKCSEKPFLLCHTVDHKFYMDWSGIESGPPRWEAGDQPLEKGMSYSENLLCFHTPSCWYGVFFVRVMSQIESLGDSCLDCHKKSDVYLPIFKIGSCRVMLKTHL